jgi:hypothetical protein
MNAQQPMPGQNVTINENGSITLSVPFAIKRKSGRRYIVTPDNVPLQYATPKHHEPLVKALIKAFHWKEMLDTGIFHTLTEIAHKEKLNISYVRRVFKMTLLAPDIIAVILDGKQPPYLSVMDFGKEIPLDWNEQRRRFGFPEIPTITQ